MSEYGIWNGSKIIARFCAPMKVVSNVPVFLADSMTLKRSVVKRTTQRWEIETALEPLVTGAEDLFLDIATKGHHTSSLVTVPQLISVRARCTAKTANDYVIKAVGTLNSSTITLSLNVTNGLLPKGTFFKFAGIDKVYVTTADRTGNGTVSIFPPLREAVSQALQIFYREDVVMPVYYDTDTMTGMAFTDGILMDLGVVKLVEKLA